MGFIGKRLMERLRAIGAGKIVAFDNFLPQVHGETPVRSFEGVTVQEGSVTDAARFREVIERHDPDLVFHLAAETGTGQSYDEIARYCDVNVGGTATLVETLRSLEDRPRRVVLSSSRAVYGEGAYRAADGSIFVPESRTTERMARGEFGITDSSGRPALPLPTPEDIVLRPSSIYASTKLMQEHVCTQGFDGTSIRPVILRFQNVYGPGQSTRNPYTGVLSIFAQQVIEGKRLEIFEDGNIVRDFVFVDDVVDALVAAARAENVGPSPINVGSGVETTILDAARILLRELGGDPDDYRISGAFRAGDVRYALADTARCRRTLGIEPRVTLAAGLALLADRVRPAPVGASR